MMDREAALAKIRANIQRHGWHVYLVMAGGGLPRFLYTLGLYEKTGYEIILSGASVYSDQEALTIVNRLASKALGITSDTEAMDMECLEGIRLREADNSWSCALMLGALDYYKVNNVPAWQVVPDEAHWTIDVPDMSRTRSGADEPAWQWLDMPWQFDVSIESQVVTNLDALQGYLVTEVARWEDDQWEMFSGPGPDVEKNQMRMVPLGTLLAFDESLVAATKLTKGKGMWRDAEGVGGWHEWESVK